MGRTIPAALALALVSFVSCGGDVRYRPLVVDVQGLSARAVRLTVLVFPGSDAPACAGLSLDAVRSLSSPMTRTWTRSVDEERTIQFDSVLEDRVVVVAYSEDDTGAPIQFGCTEVEYLDIESPEATLRLSMRASS